MTMNNVPIPHIFLGNRKDFFYFMDYALRYVCPYLYCNSKLLAVMHMPTFWVYKEPSQFSAKALDTVFDTSIIKCPSVAFL